MPSRYHGLGCSSGTGGGNGCTMLADGGCGGGGVGGGAGGRSGGGGGGAVSAGGGGAGGGSGGGGGAAGLHAAIASATASFTSAFFFFASNSLNDAVASSHLPSFEFSWPIANSRSGCGSSLYAACISTSASSNLPSLNSFVPFVTCFFASCLGPATAVTLASASTTVVVIVLRFMVIWSSGKGSRD